MNPFDRIIEKVELAKSLDAPAKLVSKYAARLLGKPDLRDALSGKQLGHPMHPLLVTLPIGAFTCASTLDLTCKSENMGAAS